MPPSQSLRALQVRAPRCITVRRYASNEAPQYNEPSGWLFGEKVCQYVLVLDVSCYLSSIKPPPPGQKRVREEWELIWYFGMFGTMALAGVLHYYKPDTRCVVTNTSNIVLLISYIFSIQTWALAEAKARMEARGEKYKYEPSSSS